MQAGRARRACALALDFRGRGTDSCHRDGIIREFVSHIASPLHTPILCWDSHPESQLKWSEEKNRVILGQDAHRIIPRKTKWWQSTNMQITIVDRVTRWFGGQGSLY